MVSAADGFPDASPVRRNPGPGQILWPLSSARFTVNALSIIDPVYSLLPLLIALIVGAVARPRIGRTAARAVFVWMALYAVFAWRLNERIERIAAEDFGRPATAGAARWSRRATCATACRAFWSELTGR